MKRAACKLRSRRGETIGEVLIALLISAVALVMLAGMIVSSGKLITNSRATMEEYYNVNNKLSTQTDTTSSGYFTATPDATITVTTNNGSSYVYLKEKSNTISVTAFQNTRISKVTPISYKKTAGDGS